MTRSLNAVSTSGIILSMLIFINAVILKTANTVDERWYWALLVSVPLLLIAIWDIRQKKHAIIRNWYYPGFYFH
jgi:hypothetical protein